MYSSIFVPYRRTHTIKHTRTHTHTHTHLHTHLHTDRMSSTVLKMRIDAPEGPADYTDTVNSDGAPHGRGSWELVEGDYKGSIFDGTFVNGKCDGFGKATWSDGDVDVGEWKSDKFHGFGQVCCVGVFHSQCFR